MMNGHMTPRELVASAKGLDQTDESWWTSSHTRELSYPDGEHAHLALIEDQSFWFAHRNRCLAHWIDLDRPPSSLLEVGAGNGFATKGLRDAGFPAVALEPSIEGARNALHRGLDPVVCSTLEDAEFPPESIPALGLFDVLEHIEDRDALLGHIRSRLWPKGRLYITVPAMSALWSSEDERAGHFLRYSTDTLREELERHGFEIRSMSYFFSFLIPPVFMFRVMAERLGLRENSEEELARDLSPPQPLARGVMDTLCELEFSWIRAGRFIPMGTSLFASAAPR